MSRIVFSIIFLLSIISCDVKKDQSEAVNLTDTTKIMENELEGCEAKKIDLDTLSPLIHRIIHPDSTSNDIDIFSINTSNNFGYSVFEYKKEKYLSLLIEKENGYEIVGTTKLNNISEKGEIADFCQSSCSGDFLCSAYVVAEKSGKITTIKAWRINEKAKSLEEINPSAVDCTDSYYTDYD